MTNLVCKIFKEQFDLIKNLPQQERKEVLYLAIEYAFNQFENQNENQNENAYISNSLSNLSISILNILNKTISVKEFSSNYGGNRKNSGRKSNENKEINQVDIQVDIQDGGQDVDKDIDKDLKIKEVNKKEIYKERFEEWWSFYPKLRAGNKQKAFDKYIKAVENEKLTPEWLLEKVKEYSNSEEVKKGYACGAEVYFNKCKYNNDYSELNEKEETVFIDEHTRIDEQMPEFNDMTFEECCRAYDWFQEQMYCQSISKSKFVEIVRRFKGGRDGN